MPSVISTTIFKSEPTQVLKVDEDSNLVFGWASSSVVDLDNEIVESADLERAVYDYVLEFRDAKELHKGDSVGQLVESLMFTPEKAASMGLPAPEHSKWWVGFHIADDETFAKVKSGEYPMFSIGGMAEREDA